MSAKTISVVSRWGTRSELMRNGADGATKAVVTELRPQSERFATWQAEACDWRSLIAIRFACASTR